MPDIGAKITRFGTVTEPICRESPANLLDFAPNGMTAYHLGDPFQCSEFSHFDMRRKCCTAKSCSCLSALPDRLMHSRCAGNALKAGRNSRSFNSMAEVAAVIVAAGRGSRAGGDLPKQFRPIGGESMLRRACQCSPNMARSALVQPVIQPDDADIYREHSCSSRSSAAGIRRRHPASFRARRARGARRRASPTSS